MIDHSGKKIAGGFKDGITPFEGDEQKLQDFFKIAVEISSKNDNFSRSLGALNYIASRRDKVMLITFPFPLSEKIFIGFSRTQP